MGPMRSHLVCAPEPTTPAWRSALGFASCAVHRHYIHVGCAAPRQNAAVVLRALPPALRRPLRLWLRAGGFLRAGAVLRFDAVERFGAAMPVDARRVLQLAVFGLPGQGLSSRDRRRTDVYQQLQAEIFSSAVDIASLDRVGARAMSRPEVRCDPQLECMLRALLAERRAALTTILTPEEAHALVEQESKLSSEFAARKRAAFPTRDEILDSFSRLRRELNVHLASFEEAPARAALEQLLALRSKFPAHIAATELQACEEQFDQAQRRSAAYRRRLESLAEQACNAALAGEHETSHWILRRLDAIHRLLPGLLPEPRVAEMRAAVNQRLGDYEKYEAAAALRDRKQAVVAQVRELARVVHAFHRVDGVRPPDDPACVAAAAEYRQALATMRKLNTEWLSGLLIELESLVDELHEQDGQAQTQLDQFIANVRIALNRLCIEIRAHQQRRAAAGALEREGTA